MVAVEVAQKFANALTEKSVLSGRSEEYSVMAGRKFDRIVSERPNEQFSRTVHAFVERQTGKLFKPAGWAAPAKNARYDLSTPEGFAQTVELADPYGSYLYQR